VVFYSDMFVDARFVEHYRAQRTFGVKVALFICGHKVGFVAQPHVSCQAG
jgi:hypothetical protein